MRKNKMLVVPFRINPIELQSFEQTAKQLGENRSQFVRRAIRERCTRIVNEIFPDTKEVKNE